MWSTASRADRLRHDSPGWRHTVIRPLARILAKKPPYRKFRPDQAHPSARPGTVHCPFFQSRSCRSWRRIRGNLTKGNIVTDSASRGIAANKQADASVGAHGNTFQDNKVKNSGLYDLFDWSAPSFRNEWTDNRFRTSNF